MSRCIIHHRDFKSYQCICCGKDYTRCDCHIL